MCYKASRPNIKYITQGQIVQNFIKNQLFEDSTVSNFNTLDTTSFENKYRDYANDLFAAIQKNIEKDDLKKKAGVADYIWSVICDLSLDCNTLMIKNFIGYYGDKNDGQGVQETLQLLRDKVDDLGEKNQQLDIKNKEQSKEINELLNIRDEQRKQLKAKKRLQSR